MLLLSCTGGYFLDEIIGLVDDLFRYVGSRELRRSISYPGGQRPVHAHV